MPCLLLLLSLVSLGACDLTAPLPPGAVRFSPPAVYSQWWKLTEQCSGQARDRADISWYHVPDARQFSTKNGSDISGYFDQTLNRIILAEDYERNGNVVRHEMLHALIPVHGHPRSAFVGRCSGVVLRIADCLDDAGVAPPPDPAAQLVKPDALHVGVGIEPSAPGSAVNDGTFSVVVSVQNRAANPVIVQLPRPLSGKAVISFAVQVFNSQTDLLYIVKADTPESMRFSALETKRFIFDFQVGFGFGYYGIGPGTYTFRGLYGGEGVTYPSPVTIGR